MLAVGAVALAEPRIDPSTAGQKIFYKHNNYYSDGNHYIQWNESERAREEFNPTISWRSTGSPFMCEVYFGVSVDGQVGGWSVSATDEDAQQNDIRYSFFNLSNYNNYLNIEFPNLNTLYLRARPMDLSGAFGEWVTIAEFHWDWRGPTISNIHRTIWRNNTNVDATRVTWSAVDLDFDGEGVGVEYYYVYFGTSANYQYDNGHDYLLTDDDSFDITEGNNFWRATANSTETYYLRLRARDKLVNYSSWLTIATCKYENTAPVLTHTAETEGWTNVANRGTYTWTAATDTGGSGVAGYYVYWGTDSGGTSTAFQAGNSYDPPALTSSGIYYLRAQAVDNAGNTSNWTTVFIYRFDNTAPFVSHNAETEGWTNTANRDAYTWTAATDTGGSGLAGYNVYWGAYSGGTSTNFRTENSYDPPALTSSGIYYLRARAVDNAGNTSNWTTVLTYKFDEDAPVLTHTAITEGWTNAADRGAYDWTEATDTGGSGVAGYNVYWGMDSSGVSTSFQTDNSYDPPALTSSGIYYLRVQAEDNAGNTSNWTTVLTYKFDGDAPVLTHTETEGWTNVTDRGVYTWTAATDSGSGLAGYYVYLGTDSSGTSTTFQINNSYYMLLATTFSGIYYLRVQTKDNLGNVGEWTTVLTYKLDVGAPVLTHTATVNGWTNVANRGTYTWTAATDTGDSGLAGYNVYWGADSGGTSAIFQTGNSYDPPALTSSGIYYLRARAVDNAGNTSNWTTVLTYKFDNTAPVLTHTAETEGWTNVADRGAYDWTEATDTGGSGLAGYNVY
ncbi:protein containing bacterial Ig-like domain, partial [Candidatus Termititenax aidoneus]